MIATGVTAGLLLPMRGKRLEIVAPNAPLLPCEAVDRADWTLAASRVALRYSWAVSFRNVSRSTIAVLFCACGGINEPPVGGDAGTIDASTSPCETSIAFQNGTDILAIDPDGSNLRNLTNRSEDSQILAVYSPDGNKIAYRSEQVVPGADLFVMNPDGSSQTQVSVEATDDVSFGAWMSDTRLVFLARVGGLVELRAVNADGSGRQSLAVNVSLIGALSVSIATQKVLFARPEMGGLVSIHSVNADGSGEVPLFTNAAGVRYSPDGQFIAFQRADDIYVVPASGSGEVNLTSNATDPSATPRWFPSGRLYFGRSIAGTNDVFTMNRDGSNQQNITRTPAIGESFVTASPDELSFSFAAEGQLFVVNRVGSGRTALPGTEDGIALSWQPCR